MPISPGTRFHHYEIIAPIGAGGMGEVYLAEDTTLNRKVALKLLPAEFTQDAARLGRFALEARAASALNHPNLITIHEIGQTDGTHYLVTEFIEGATLRQRLKHERLSLPTTLDIAAQIASALTAARTDIFSLGIVLYEMIAGCAPFSGATVSDVIAEILKTEPRELTNVAPDTPAELQRIVSKALQKDRERRYQTSKDLLLDLQTLKQELELEARLKGRDASHAVAPTVSLPPVTTDERNDTRTTSSASIILSELKRHKRGVMITLVALVLLLGGIGYGLYRVIEHSSSNSTPPLALQFTPLTSHGRAVAAAISPDGKYVAYAKDEDGKQSLWLRQTAVVSEQAISPAADVDYRKLTFSRDDNFLYYVVREPNTSTNALYRMSALGQGQKRRIEGVDSVITFSPDGKRLAFVRKSLGGREMALLIADADGGNERVLTVRKRPDFFLAGNGISLNGLAWSPDGKLIACEDREQEPPKLAVISYAGGQPVKTFDYPISKGSVGNNVGFHIRWTPDGHALTYILTLNNVSNLWQQPFDGGPPKQITDFKAERIHHFDWSRDGKLVLARGTDQNDVVLISGFK